MKSGHFSRKGYTKLANPLSFHSSKIKKYCPRLYALSSSFQKVFVLFGHYFSLTTHYASYALLPVTLLYLNDKGPVIPSIVYILAMLTFFLGILYQLQDMLLYHPNMPDTARLYVAAPPPNLLYEEVSFTTADNVKIHGYFLKQKEEQLKDCPTLVYFHGNAGNASSPSVIPMYVSCGANVLMIDYRGYGLSTGIPSEEGLYRDGEAAVKYLHSRDDIDLRKIVLYGHSLGGAVAIHIASKSQWVKGRIAAVIVENTFANIPSTAATMFSSLLPFLHLLPNVCFKNRFDSISKIHDITVPMLFICGTSDKIVPPEMSRSLFQAAGNPRSAMVIIPNGDHNDTWCALPALYQESLSRFVGKVFESGVGHAWSRPESSEERASLSYEWQNYVYPYVMNQRIPSHILAQFAQS